MHKDMSLAEIWEKTSSVRDEGILVFLDVQSDQKPTGLTASNPCVALCELLHEGVWSVALWRSQLDEQALKDPDVAGLIVDGLQAARRRAIATSLSGPSRELE